MRFWRQVHRRARKKQVFTAAFARRRNSSAFLYLANIRGSNFVPQSAVPYPHESDAIADNTSAGIGGITCYRG